MLHCQRLLFFHMELHRHVTTFQQLSMELRYLQGAIMMEESDLQTAIVDLAHRSKTLNRMVGDAYDQLAHAITDMEPYFSQEVSASLKLFLEHGSRTLYPAHEMSLQLGLVDSHSALAALPKEFIDNEELDRLWNGWFVATDKLFAEIKRSIKQPLFEHLSNKLF